MTIKKKIVPLKNMQLQGKQLEKDKPVTFTFPNKKVFESLLSFGNFKEATEKEDKINIIEKDNDSDKDSTPDNNEDIPDSQESEDTAQTSKCEDCGVDMVMSREDENMVEYVCPICSNTKVIEKDGVDNQNKDVSSSLDNDKETLDSDDTDNTHQKFECPYEDCDREFDSERGLKMHISKTHG